MKPANTGAACRESLLRTGLFHRIKQNIWILNAFFRRRPMPHTPPRGDGVSGLSERHKIHRKKAFQRLNKTVYLIRKGNATSSNMDSWRSVKGILWWPSRLFGWSDERSGVERIGRYWKAISCEIKSLSVYQLSEILTDLKDSVSQ